MPPAAPCKGQLGSLTASGHGEPCPGSCGCSPCPGGSRGRGGCCGGSPGPTLPPVPRFLLPPRLAAGTPSPGLAAASSRTAPPQGWAPARHRAALPGPAPGSAGGTSSPVLGTAPGGSGQVPAPAAGAGAGRSGAAPACSAQGAHAVGLPPPRSTGHLDFRQSVRGRGLAAASSSSLGLCPGLSARSSPGVTSVLPCGLASTWARTCPAADGPSCCHFAEAPGRGWPQHCSVTLRPPRGPGHMCPGPGTGLQAQGCPKAGGEGQGALPVAGTSAQGCSPFAPRGSVLPHVRVSAGGTSMGDPPRGQGPPCPLPGGSAGRWHGSGSAPGGAGPSCSRAGGVQLPPPQLHVTLPAGQHAEQPFGLDSFTA